jgi:hypothetical protein
MSEPNMTSPQKREEALYALALEKPVGKLAVPGGNLKTEANHNQAKIP